MSMYLGDFVEDDSDVVFYWNTNDSNGASITRATDGTVKLLRDDATDCTAGAVTDTEDNPDTGIHRCVLDLSGNANCIVGHDYLVWLDGAVIDGQTVNSALAHLSIDNRPANISVDTTLAVRTSDSVFTINAGSGTNAYGNGVCAVFDVSGHNWECRKITGYVGASKTVTVDTAFSFTVAANDLVRIFKGTYVLSGTGATAAQVHEYDVSGITTQGQAGYEIQQRGGRYG